MVRRLLCVETRLRALRSRPPDRLLEVDYEAFVHNFEAQARQIIRFCGLAWTPAVLDFSSVERPVRTASAYQVRQGLFASSIGRWRHYQANLAHVVEMLDAAPRQAAAS